MGNLFGKKKHESRVTEQDKAVLQLKQQRDQLKVYQRRIESQLGRDRETAKQLLLKGNKDKAKLLLRKKKYQESLLAKTDQQLENIERMTHDLEFAQIEVQVVEGLKFGNEALNKLHQILRVEDVERIMDETQEAVNYQREIDAALAGGLTLEDEEDVLQELNDIIQETEGQNARLPDVPTDDLPTAAREQGGIRDKQSPTRDLPPPADAQKDAERRKQKRTLVEA